MHSRIRNYARSSYDFELLFVDNGTEQNVRPQYSCDFTFSLKMASTDVVNEQTANKPAEMQADTHVNIAVRS